VNPNMNSPPEKRKLKSQTRSPGLRKERIEAGKKKTERMRVETNRGRPPRLILGRGKRGSSHGRGHSNTEGARIERRRRGNIPFY